MGGILLQNWRESESVVESASLTAGTEATLTGKITVPSGMSKLVGVYVSSQGGGILKLEATSLGTAKIFPVGDQATPFEGMITPCSLKVTPENSITLKRTGSTATTTKYEVIILFFA